jgi:ABC-type multidrug transport system ATPase subunit/pSer/pThr/pTyr-binding forkhead associated (FHA) protein
MDAGNGPSVPGSLRFLTGPMVGNTYQVTKSITHLGREPGNDVVISDPSVSRHHAEIIWSNGGWNIKKLATQNILTINQQNIQQATPLNDGDTIGFGAQTTCLFLTNIPNGVRPSQQTPVAKNAPPPRVPGPEEALLRGSPPPPPPPGASFMPPEPGRGGIASTERVSLSSIQAVLPGQGIPGSANYVGVPTLEVSTNVDTEKHPYPLTKQVISIGRDPANDIVIDRPTVSSFHAQIVREGNAFVFIHPHPTRGKTLNGIIYQGHTIAGTEQFRKTLARGDVFRISDAHGTLVTLTYNDGTGKMQDSVPELHPIALGAPIITIGRAADNDVVLNHPQVSGYHARLELLPNGYRILDRGSTNHVYVNTQRVTQQVLTPGDEVRIGPFKLTYTGKQLTQVDESNGVRIDALRLHKEGNKRVVLLNDISLVIPPRKFVALVGGSGAGKSTLMDALNGLRPAQQGLVFYNGKDYYRHLAAFSTQLGYVPQDDIIHRDLTVEHALYYAARLRLPEDFTEKQIHERIEAVLDDVEMKSRRRLLVSRLSGGQRKRVSIALELLANPSIFFLDEPTSGLDPGLDRKMMLLLRKLADKGHTIVLVTHATNNINACDYVCFLTQGGRMAYYGPPNDAKTYFGKTDFAEIYSALEPTEEHPDIPALAEEKFKQSPEFAAYVTEPLKQGPASRADAETHTVAVKPPRRGNPWLQFRILATRYLELLKNDKVNLAILLLQAPIIGLILFFLASLNTFSPTSIATCPHHTDIVNNAGPTSIDCQQELRELNALSTPQGLAFKAQNFPGKSDLQIVQDSILFGSGGDAQKILFIMAFAAVMFGCMNGAREIVKEEPIYRRERTVNLGIIPYMFSKIIVLGVLCLVQSFILVLFVNLKTPFVYSILLPPFVEIYITMALTSLAGLMIGLAISAIVPNSDRSMSIVPIALIPQVIFSGVLFSLDSPQFLQVLGAFFPARWARAAMGSTVGLHGDKLGADAFSYWGTLVAYSQSDAVIHLFLSWGVLVVMIVLLALATAYLLKRKDVRT